MKNSYAHSISASLATLRSGGWLCVKASAQEFSIRTTDVSGDGYDSGDAFSNALGNMGVLMSNRLAETIGEADDSKPQNEPVFVGNSSNLIISPALACGILALLKMAHVTPACEISIDTDPSVTVFIDEDCLLSLNGPAYPLVFNHSVTMPTTWSDKTELHLFSEQQDAKREHLAAICKNSNTDVAPLVRVHSKCVTGDIFNSLRCDCGEQLNRAKEMIGEAGNGILIYLDQEGRGIGLRNKLAAYTLQDTGTDTFEANHQLGYESDERTYEAAITMLEHLGVTKIRLLTNNPDKIDQLGSKIEVVERVALIAADEPNRQSYIDAKKQSGHLLQ